MWAAMRPDSGDTVCMIHVSQSPKAACAPLIYLWSRVRSAPSLLSRQPFCSLFFLCSFGSTIPEDPILSPLWVYLLLNLCFVILGVIWV